jgi:two-component system, response regulator PdtaR
MPLRRRAHFSQRFLRGRNIHLGPTLPPKAASLLAGPSVACMDGAVPSPKPVVLVVEDEGLIRTNAVEMIEMAGFEAISASDADEAIRILESRNDIRAVFTDVQMPGSMDGLRLARVVRNRWPPVALIVTSGQTKIPDLPSGGRFLSKPYHPGQVETTLRQLIG